MAEGIKVNPATEEEIMETSHLPLSTTHWCNTIRSDMHKARMQVYSQHDVPAFERMVEGTFRISVEDS